MKVVFLDFDGVLNTTPHMVAYIWRNGMSIHPSLFIEKKIDLLNYITRATGAVIVISSTWRTWSHLATVAQVLELAGVEAPVIGKTPNFGERGLEILAWLSENGPVDGYVVLDDNTVRHHGARFVQTDGGRGLMPRDVAAAIEVLN